ncbi:hypothetical protein [Actinoplanes sp. M2I2]|uniref:hypothetical protein n=1 Tax=Actinoplanes sp. M2I2 TaxID=1734444 RepID=UPI002021910D|nr:hypothetical protein [Actinoplanes sp. M2I2]
MSITPIGAALLRAHRHDIEGKAAVIQAMLRGEQLTQPAVVNAASVRVLVALSETLNTQLKALQGQVKAHIGRHPDAELIRFQPKLGVILAGRVRRRLRSLRLGEDERTTP